MKTIDLSVPEKIDFCVCSVLQAILKANGEEISQGEIARNLTPGNEMGFQIHDEKIKNFLLGKGFRYDVFWCEDSSFFEPERLLFEMRDNYGIVGIEFIDLKDGKKYNHVYLLRDFNDPMIKMADPNTGIEREIEVNYRGLLRVSGHSDFFGLVKRI